MANHKVKPHATVAVQPNDTVEITEWPGAQQAGDRALLMGNLPPGSGGESVSCYTATVTHTTENSVKVVKVTVPSIPSAFYRLHLSTGGAFIQVVGIRVE